MPEDERRPPKVGFWPEDIQRAVRAFSSFRNLKYPDAASIRAMSAVLNPATARAFAKQLETLRPATPTSPPPRRARRGRKPGHIAPATKAANAALVAYFASGRRLPAKVRELAREAAALATELGLEGADLLDPDAGAMRDLSESALAAAERALARRK
jgi:hypothetical protein